MSGTGCETCGSTDHLIEWADSGVLRARCPQHPDPALLSWLRMAYEAAVEAGGARTPRSALPAEARDATPERDALRRVAALLTTERARHRERHGDYRTDYRHVCSVCSVQRSEPYYNESRSWREAEDWPCATSQALDAALAGAGVPGQDET